MSPNFLTGTEAPSSGQIVWDKMPQCFLLGAMWNICGSALTAPVRVLTAMQLHLPHGPNPFARHLAMRRGIPRTSRCKYEKDSPGKGTEYEFSRCPARCLNCVAEICLPTCKSSISRRVRSRRKRAQTVSMGFKSPLHGGNLTDCKPCLRVYYIVCAHSCKSQFTKPNEQKRKPWPPQFNCAIYM